MCTVLQSFHRRDYLVPPSHPPVLNERPLSRMTMQNVCLQLPLFRLYIQQRHGGWELVEMFHERTEMIISPWTCGNILWPTVKKCYTPPPIVCYSLLLTRSGILYWLYLALLIQLLFSSYFPNIHVATHYENYLY